jgi:hypothetical protein
MKKRLALLTICLFSLGLVLASCAGVETKPTASNFKTPVIKLASFEVPQYDEYWYYAKSVKPTKGKEGDRGAPLPMSFLFEIQNPNDYPVLLEGITYTVAFDKDFEVITTNVNDSYWIPADKTDQVRVSTFITVRSALTGLLLANAVALKKKGWSPWDALERWWNGVPNAKVPVTVKEASFSFRADGVSKAVPFEATYP